MRVKWPNDIYARGLKVGGILINTTISQGCFNIVCGVGLNLDNRQPTTCINQLLADARASPASQTEQAAAQAVGQARGEGAGPSPGQQQAPDQDLTSGHRPGQSDDGSGAQCHSRGLAAAGSDAGNSEISEGHVSRELLLACIMNQLEECFQVRRSRVASRWQRLHCPRGRRLGEV